MAKNQGQPAASKPAAVDHESEFLKRNAALIQETSRVYALGAKATAEQRSDLRKRWEETLNANKDWTAAKDRFGMAVVENPAFDGVRLFGLVYPDHVAKRLGHDAESMRNVAALVETRVRKFAPFEAERLLDLYFGKFGREAAEAGDLLATMQHVEASRNRDVDTLIYWVESSNRRRVNRAEKTNETKRAIHDEMADEMATEDQRAKLEAQITAAEAEEAEAVKEKRYANAAKVAETLAGLRKQLEELDSQVEEVAEAEEEPETDQPAADTAPTAASTPTTDTETAAPTPTADPLMSATDAFRAAIGSSKLSKGVKEGFMTAADNAFAAGDLAALTAAQGRFKTFQAKLSK